MATKISFSVTVPTSVQGVADLYSVREKLNLQGLDPAKAQEYARSALDEALQGPSRGSPATLSKVTFIIEPADAAADVAFPSA